MNGEKLLPRRIAGVLICAPPICLAFLFRVSNALSPSVFLCALVAALAALDYRDGASSR